MDIKDIFEQIKILRNPETGCPWDQKQVLENYAKHISEEAEELVAAIENYDIENICEEAGDLLWNICFVITLAEENGYFKRDHVLKNVIKKMTNRHPHVFGNVSAKTPEEAYNAFMAAKGQEK